MNSEEEGREKADHCETGEAKGNDVPVVPSVEETTQPSCEVSTDPSNCDKLVETDTNLNCCHESKEDCETKDVKVASLPEIKVEETIQPSCEVFADSNNCDKSIETDTNLNCCKESKEDCETNDVNVVSLPEIKFEETIQPSCEVSTDPSECDKSVETDTNLNCCQESKEDCEIKEEGKNGDIIILDDDEVDCKDIDNAASDKLDETSKTQPDSLDLNSPTGEKDLIESPVQSLTDNQDSQTDKNNSSLEDIERFQESEHKDFSQSSPPESLHSEQSEENAEDVDMLSVYDGDDNTPYKKDAVKVPESDNSNIEKSPARKKKAGGDLDPDESESSQLNSQTSEENTPPQIPAATSAPVSSQGVTDIGKMGTSYNKPPQKKRSKKDLRDNKKWNKNLLFYKGEIPSEPDGDYIDKIHEEWWNNFSLLEHHHGYIQWLFPIRENGMNYHAQPLQLHEAQAIMEDKAAHARVLVSYNMMLNFYGMKLEDDETGKIQRSKHYKKCFENLSQSSHNYLRITRILRSLGELGYEYLKKPFLEFVIFEATIEGTLSNTLDSCKNYWIGTIKNDDDRKELYSRIERNSKPRLNSKWEQMSD